MGGVHTLQRHAPEYDELLAKPAERLATLIQPLYIQVLCTLALTKPAELLAKLNQPAD